MLQFLKRFFNKPAASTPEAAPYKVETPTPVTEPEIKSDGGIWPFPTVPPVVESAPYKVPEPAATTPIPLVPAESVTPTKPAKKAPAAKKTPAAKKAPAQPRAKKTPNK